MSAFPIDAVITWVDGSDPVHRSKIRGYAPERAFTENDVAGPTRFANDGEIHWCVASIRRYAPFIRKIWIVTDGQDPHVQDGNIPVEVVDHKQIFRGYEDFLPVFNSVAIETMTWRIPGLSDHYVEFNDDFLVCRPLAPEDFFAQDGTPVCHAVRSCIAFDRFTRALKKKENGHRKVTFKGLMLNGAVLAGARFRYLRLNHTPRPLNRLWFENWYGEHPEELRRNISFRFRNPDQFTPQEVQFVSLWRSGKLDLKPVKGNLFYMETRSGKDYIRKKLERFRKGNYKYMCLNSVDRTGPEDRKLIDETVRDLVGL